MNEPVRLLEDNIFQASILYRRELLYIILESTVHLRVVVKGNREMLQNEVAHVTCHNNRITLFL